MDTGILLLRVVVGLTLAAHGAQKLFGWFGGHGIGGTAAFLEDLGFRPGRPYAYLAGAVEFLGGLCLALGLFTPLATAAVIGQMAVAAWVVHLPHGFFNSAGGYEFPLTLAASAATVALAGPGAYSLDGALGLTAALELAPWGIVLGLVAALLALGSRALFGKGARVQPA